jgi:hypothetical protein
MDPEVILQSKNVLIVVDECREGCDNVILLCASDYRSSRKLLSFELVHHLGHCHPLDSLVRVDVFDQSAENSNSHVRSGSGSESGVIRERAYLSCINTFCAWSERR